MATQSQDEFEFSHVQKRLLPHPSAIGMLDWTTGLVALNADKDDYEAMRQWSADVDSDQPIPSTKLGISFRTLSEAKIHEFVHCLQINLCGYPFKLATDLWSGLEDSLENFDRALNSLAMRVDNVSAVDVLESSALLAQKRSVHPKMRTPAYRHLIDEAVPSGSAYRQAFDAAYTAWEGTAPEAIAIEAFQLLANVSLCSHSPGETLVRLASLSAKKSTMNQFRKVVVGNYEVGIKFDYMHWNSVLKECIDELDVKMLGDSTQVLHRSHPTPYHPIFSRTLWRIANLGAKRKGLLMQLHAHPHEWTFEIFAVACPPIVLRSEPGSIEASTVSLFPDELPDDIPYDELLRGLLRTVGLNDLLRQHLYSHRNDLLLNEIIDVDSPIVRGTRWGEMSSGELGVLAKIFKP